MPYYSENRFTPLGVDRSGDRPAEYQGFIDEYERPAIGAPLKKQHSVIGTARIAQRRQAAGQQRRVDDGGQDLTRSTAQGGTS